MGSDMASCWGWYVSTLGYDVSTLGVGAATPGTCALGDCAAIVDLGTLVDGGVGGMRVFGIEGMQDLRHIMRSLIFGLFRSRTVVNWDGLSHCWNISHSYVISFNCVSQVNAGLSGHNIDCSFHAGFCQCA